MISLFFVVHTSPLPMVLRIRMGNEMASLMKAGKIHHSNKPCNHSPIIVTRKTGDIRICLDARKLNTILIDEYECYHTNVSHSFSNNFRICEDLKLVKMSLVGTARPEEHITTDSFCGYLSEKKHGSPKPESPLHCSKDNFKDSNLLYQPLLSQTTTRNRKIRASYPKKRIHKQLNHRFHSNVYY